MRDCLGVGGRKYDVECGVVRCGPIGSDGVISHTGTLDVLKASYSAMYRLCCLSATPAERYKSRAAASTEMR